MELRKIVSVVGLAAVLGAAGPAWSAPTIGFGGGGAFASGAAVSVDVIVSDLPVGEAVTAYDLDVGYDAGALSLDSVAFSLMLGDPGLFEVLEGFGVILPGLLDMWSVSLLDDVDLVALQAGGPVTLATLQFTALTAGNTDSLAFVNWGPFNDVKGINNEIIIGQVPEPASFGLAALALLGLAMTRRQR